MAQPDGIGIAAAAAKRPAFDSSSVSGSSTSDESARKRSRKERKRKRKDLKRRHREQQEQVQEKEQEQEQEQEERQRAEDADVAGSSRSTTPSGAVNGHSRRPGAFEQRRNSLSKAARDPRDKPRAKSSVVVAGQSQKARPPSPIIDFDGLSRPGRGTRRRVDEDADASEERLQKMRAAVRTLLECVGEDPDREGLLETPSRYAKALLFLTKGYQANVDDILNNAIFNEGQNEMIIVRNIEIHSLCEHHLVPFVGKMHIGYIPCETVIGLSKLPRIAEMFARRLQIQERLTKEVAHAIMEILKPQGVAVAMESSHLCMVMRGVEQTSSTTVTSCVLGCFERKSKTRAEFFSLIGDRRS
ncbi:hypothetical protein DCS_08084 [Drechmeria coniospora]|uniref:GTP cyclohydrolase 1 n=1 Tax=Drechmeria coniospora TaxID=98403 RepID=A0A151GG91_DRECN|nr:hypothetical protein DCS_08084 [Drechmeria coniospora]KYK56118.1 hypothetical protein DCS_08084 [Drechmeria coniospora]